MGVHLIESTNSEVFKYIKYSSPNDSHAIKAITTTIDSSRDFKGFQFEPKIDVVDEKELFDKMKNVSQYASANIQFSIKRINVEDVFFLTQHVKGYKLRQIKSIINLYEKNDITLFRPTKICYKDNRYTLVGIPVIEEINGKQFVIEGNTRLYYCHRNKKNEVYVLYVQNVEVPLPSNGRFKIKQMLITDSDLRGAKRYTDFNYRYFRDIEKSIRNPKDCLV